MSLNSEQYVAIDDIISAKMNVKESFTAYDITLVLRAEGYWVEHNDVKEYVHECMKDNIEDGSSYVKELQNVTPNSKAFVYSPCEDEDDIISFDDLDEIMLEVDARGRLCIPAKMVRACNFKPGDIVSCIDNGDECIAIIDGSSSYGIDAEVAQYAVDKDSNIRISSRILNKVIGDFSCFTVYYDDFNERIVVFGD